MSTAPSTTYYGHDAHGNITFLADATGAVTDSYDYDAWGVLVASTGSTTNTRLYAAEEFDPDLGLTYLRARQYRPSTGRFLTIDPFDGVASPLRSPNAVSALAGPFSSPSIRAIFELSVTDGRGGRGAGLLNSAMRHRYGYGSGDPVMSIDPTGLYAVAGSYANLAASARATTMILVKFVLPTVAVAFIFAAVAVDTINAIVESLVDRLENDETINCGDSPRCAECIYEIRQIIRASIEAVIMQVGTDFAAWDRPVREIYQDAVRRLLACLVGTN